MSNFLNNIDRGTVDMTIEKFMRMWGVNSKVMSQQETWCKIHDHL